MPLFNRLIGGAFVIVCISNRLCVEAAVKQVFGGYLGEFISHRDHAISVISPNKKIQISTITFSLQMKFI